MRLNMAHLSHIKFEEKYIQVHIFHGFVKFSVAIVVLE